MIRAETDTIKMKIDSTTFTVHNTVLHYRYMYMYIPYMLWKKSPV